MPSYCDPEYASSAYYEDLYTCDSFDRGNYCQWCENEERYNDDDVDSYESAPMPSFGNRAGIVDGCDCNACEAGRRGDSTARMTDVWPVGILSYSHKPSMTFWHKDGLSRTRLGGRFGARDTYMGTEVEIEFSGTHQARQTLANAWQAHAELTERLYCKDDSSLVNGVEVVSMPMTLDAWQQLHASGELEFFRKCEEAGTMSTDRCGQHIHVNRSSFQSLAHQARFTALIIRNAANMQTVANRIEESYASFQRFNACQVLKGYRSGPRGAVNLNNSATIEVRMFASTHDPDGIMANLEFVHACQAFTRQRSTVDGCKVPIREALTFSAFGAWMGENAATYPLASSLPVVRQYAVGTV